MFRPENEYIKISDESRNTGTCEFVRTRMDSNEYFPSPVFSALFGGSARGNEKPCRADAIFL
jgi:hypothetical protein